MAIRILTFPCSARAIEIIDHIAQGSGYYVFVALYTMPIVLTFTIPWAILVAVILVFGRLSADTDNAMRACGISIYRLFRRSC